MQILCLKDQIKGSHLEPKTTIGRNINVKDFQNCVQESIASIKRNKKCKKFKDNL